MLRAYPMLTRELQEMREKLTPGFVAKAPSPESGDRIIYWDAEMRGFGLMVTSAGHRSYVVQYRAARRSRRMHLKAGLNLTEARKEARAILGAVAKGHDPLSDRRKKEGEAANTLKSVAEEYFAREGKRLRTIEERRTVLERLVIPRLGARQIDEIKRTDIVRLLDRIEDENGPVMADHVLAYLRRVMTWHAGRSDDFRSPIVRGMARTKPGERRRQRVLTDDEIRAVWRAAETSQGAFGYFVQFILLTAVRRNEAAHMRHGEVSGNDWIIPQARYKTGLELLVPLSPMAQDVLAKVPKIGRGDLLFTTDGRRPLSGFSKFKRALDEACGVTGWTLHDLRRTARTLMSRAGVSSDHAERCLGHVIGGVRGTYDRHQFAAEKRIAFEKLGTLIEHIINRQPNVVPLRAAE
jgi:integrase